jgi:hypothetical protein
MPQRVGDPALFNHMHKEQDMPTNQIKLNPELENWFTSRQKALNVAKTTTTPTGQTIDWVPLASQVASGKLATPPPVAAPRTEALHAAEKEAQQTVKPVSFELDDPKAERGPAGTVPVLRPDLSRFAGLTVENFLNLTKKGGLKVNPNRPKAPATPPDPAGYYHNICNQSGRFYGWDGRLNVWDPAINTPAGGNGEDHSILQVWLQNYDKPQLQSLEGGITIDHSLNGDTQPHVFTYFTVNGYTSDGDNKGGYNRLHKGWVQYSPTVFPGIRINGTSTLNGTQFDIGMKFQLYKEPNSNDVNWWISVQGIWMGYYPASLYSGGLGNYAEWVGSGGEIYSGLADPSQTHDQMGSGWQAAGGWAKAAFLRNLRVQTDMNGNMANNNGTASSDVAKAGAADPYTIDLHMNSGSSWGSYFYVGGPTRVAARSNILQEAGTTRQEEAVLVNAGAGTSH